MRRRCVPAWATMLFFTVALQAPIRANAAETVESPATHVEVVVEAAGELKFKDKDALKSLPTAVAARFAYDEKPLADDADGLPRTIRRYRSADPTIRVDATTLRPKLRDDRNLIIARRSEAQSLIYSPLGPLNSDELELLQLPFSSLLVDELLLDQASQIGESWKHDDGLLCALLNLDAVSKSEVSSKLVEVTDDSARVEFNGLVQGALGGVAAEYDLTGRYKIDLLQNRITWLAVLIKEKRSIGHVEPGVEATTRVQMTLAPIDTPADLAAGQLRNLELSPLPELLRLEYVSPTGEYGLGHTRQWSIMADAREVLSLRLIDRGELVAQCNVRTVTLPDPTKRPTLTQFQADVRRSLDKSFKQFVRVTEGSNEIGQTIFRCEAVGTVEELDIRWIYYLVLDPSGRQIVFAFTVEEPLVERFAEADVELIGTVRFLDPTATTARLGAPETAR